MTGLASNGKEFGLSEVTLDELVVSLSAGRIGTYVTATGGDRAKAARLHTRNRHISIAFYGPLQAQSAACRNAMNREPAFVFGQARCDDCKSGLDSGCLARMEQINRDLRIARYPDNRPQVVASLSFGFRAFLLGQWGFIDWKTYTKPNCAMTFGGPISDRCSRTQPGLYVSAPARR